MNRPHAITPIPALLLAILALSLAAFNVKGLLPDNASWRSIVFPDPDVTAQMLLHHTVLPRIVVGLMVGGGLGLAGAVLQRILRNPLAEPATLGISAGAYLVLSIATLWFPAWLALGREWIAFAGAVLALLAVLSLSWRKGLSPVTVTLAGMIVSLYCGAVSAALTLFNHDFLTGIFLWGAGYLDQQDWGGVQFLYPRLLPVAILLVFLVRPLTLLGVDDDSARSLGLSIAAYRLIALVAAAALTAIVTASVGIISFVGLAGPALARASGARRTGVHLVWSALLGALLLMATDQIVLCLPVTYRLFPTGAVTALLGAPLLFVLIRHLKLLVPPQVTPSAAPGRLRHPIVVLCLLVALLLPAFWLALAVGQGPDGWSFAAREEIMPFLDWRAPRALAAFSGGAMLALAGAILQRMTSNPMASPEVLGVSSGAMLGVILLLLMAAAPTRGEQIAAGTLGALAVLFLTLGLSRKPGFSGDRLLLVGITLGAVSGFVMAVLMTSQDPRLDQLLAWLSGSTYAVRPREALLSTALLVVALASIPFIRRWLELLSLGLATATAVGVPITPSRNILLSISALLTAGATILVGPLSFAGLMGPHIARLAGFHRAGTQLAASAIVGGLVLLVADWLGRNIIFPFQIPAGLLATLVGGPFLLVLIARRG